MYPLLETIKIEDGVAFHLEWHQERLKRSYRTYYDRDCPYSLNTLINVPSDCSSGLFKCRFLYGLKEMRLEFSHYEPRVITSLQLVHAGELDYSLKYTDRKALKDLLLLKGRCDDILIVKDGRITDTSFSNIVFYDGSNWLTPKMPILNGTTRMRLLSEARIHGADLKVDDLIDMESFRLINAMLEFDEQFNNPISHIHRF